MCVAPECQQLLLACKLAHLKGQRLAYTKFTSNLLQVHINLRSSPKLVVWAEKKFQDDLLAVTRVGSVHRRMLSAKAESLYSRDYRIIV